MVWFMFVFCFLFGKNIIFYLFCCSLIIVGIVFGVGLLLFLVVWLSSCNNDFYKVSFV